MKPSFVFTFMLIFVFHSFREITGTKESFFFVPTVTFDDGIHASVTVLHRYPAGRGRARTRASYAEQHRSPTGRRSSYRCTSRLQPHPAATPRARRARWFGKFSVGESTCHRRRRGTVEPRTPRAHYVGAEPPSSERHTCDQQHGAAASRSTGARGTRG